MDENTLSALLHKAPDNLNPLSHSVDLDKALKNGRRHQLRTRATITAAFGVATAAATAAVIAIVAVTTGSGSGLPSTKSLSVASGSGTNPAYSVSTAPTTASAITPAPAVAPKSFNPLELPVNFGWLPTGFTENVSSPDGFPMSQGPLEVLTNEVSFGASTATGEGFQVTVAARGATLSPWLGGGTGSNAELKVIGTAPDIDGHPAKWVADGLEWEYASGGWAVLLTGVNSTTAPRSGWGQMCSSTNMSFCEMPVAKTAALNADLLKVASNLSWTPTPFKFMFKFTQALPSGWTPDRVIGGFVKGVLTYGEFDLDSAVLAVPHTLGNDDTDEALDISSSVGLDTTSSCQRLLNSYEATYGGVKWTIVMGGMGLGGVNIPTWTSDASPCPDPLGTHGSSLVSIVTDSAADNQVGEAGFLDILPIIKFLGANPADWTTNPLTQ